MDEQELERRLNELKATWRVPGDLPLDEMWQVVEARAFPDAAPRRGSRWIRTLLPLAAMLLLGFGIGQLAPALLPTRPAADLAAVPSGVAVSEAKDATAPFVGVATDYLERVTMLLVALADAAREGEPPEHSAGQARDLLATTRLLLDSPQAGDPRLQTLLQDLELVLVQIVRLPRRPPQPDVYLIDQTVDQREVLPRLRDMLAENSTSQP